MVDSDPGKHRLTARATTSDADELLSKARGLAATVSANQALPSKASPEPDRRRALLVNGRQALPATLGAALTARGLQVRSAERGDAASRAILEKRKRPELVLVDVATPGLAPVAFCRFIFDHSLLAGSRVLLCAPSDDARHQPRAAQAPSTQRPGERELSASELLRCLE